MPCKIIFVQYNAEQHSEQNYSFILQFGTIQFNAGTFVGARRCYYHILMCALHTVQCNLLQCNLLHTVQ